MFSKRLVEFVCWSMEAKGEEGETPSARFKIRA
jgi:hypothetical protein